ncbi:MAG: hypothetical protein LBI03_11640, partial [Clostridiales bacterium]|nr:hypothetical protein [Clostridiales bacterium]
MSKIFIHLNLCLHLNLKIPTHTTVLNWTKKQGISQFRAKSFYQQEKWVLILDESIQFGNKKLLLVLAVPENRCSKPGALSYKDLTPLVLKVSHSWKSEDIIPVIKEHIDLEQISYCIFDTGSNLTSAIKSLECKHIADVNHKISLIIKQVFEDSELFNNYVKALALLRAQKSMSKIARIVPPNQRIMSRFMNLTPLFEWGIKMTALLDTCQLTEDEKATLSFLETYREFIFDSYQILLRLNAIQKILKNKGFSNTSAGEVNTLFSGMGSDNSLKVKNGIDEYIADLTGKSEGKTICCSSDIIESCFGKYKEIVKGNKSVGISDLSLSIAAMMGNNCFDKNKTEEAMETVSIKHVKDWK